MSPQHYLIEEGKLYGGEYPGDRNPDVARARLRFLISIGIRTFVDLTGPADRMESYEELLTELEAEAGAALRRISLPIADMGVPESMETMQTIMESIRESASLAPAVYVHCWGGIGRTGTVVGCWLRECGYDPEAALAHVQHLYASHMPKVRIHAESPQTPAQKDYIRNWMAAC
jgi:protein tyrosine/serine phosphatase